MKYIIDLHSKNAKKKGFLARSVFKLIYLNKKYSLFNKDSNVLDLGCAPGSWIQYIRTQVINGTIIGVDILPIKVHENNKFYFIKKDIYKIKLEDITSNLNNNDKKFNVIISDMAPNTTGINDLDCYNSFLLFKRAMEIVNKTLKKDGICCLKIFSTVFYKNIVKKYKLFFQKIILEKPNIIKKGSKEIYVVFYKKMF